MDRKNSKEDSVTPNHADALLTLHEQARSFMRECEFFFDEEFFETGEGEEIKFDGREEGKRRKLEWLKMCYFETQNGIPGICVTFGSQHDSLPDRISKKFFLDQQAYFGLSDEERERLAERQKVARQQARKKAEEDKRIADEYADIAKGRWAAAIQSKDGKQPKGKDTYFSLEGVEASGDIRYEIHKRYLDDGIMEEECIAIAAIKDARQQTRALQEFYPSKRDFGDGKLRNKNTVGKTSGAFFLHGALPDKDHPDREICVCEGVKDALCIFKATNRTSCAALGGGLEKVVQECRQS